MRINLFTWSVLSYAVTAINLNNLNQEGSSHHSHASTLDLDSELDLAEPAAPCCDSSSSRAPGISLEWNCSNGAKKLDIAVRQAANCS